GAPSEAGGGFRRTPRHRARSIRSRRRLPQNSPAPRRAPSEAGRGFRRTPRHRGAPLPKPAQASRRTPGIVRCFATVPIALPGAIPMPVRLQETAMQLLYTPRSHFSRKVRILLHAYGLAHKLVDAGRVEARDPSAFGPNPLMKVPTLIDGDAVVMDSDQIAAYLVRHDPRDRYRVLTTELDALNARAVLNGTMAAEVELLLAA